MTTVRSTLALLALLLILPGFDLDAQQRAGAEARTDLLVSPEWVAARLDDPSLVLLHVGERPEYDQEHIPGARFLSLLDIATAPDAPGPPLEMLEPAALRKKLEQYGISDDSRIVVYFGRNWVTPTTRVLLTLDWIGLGDRTSLLDGGMPRWRAERRPLTAELPTVKAGRLSARATRDIIVDHAAVSRSIRAPGTVIIDARAPRFYSGPAHGQHRAGHIPGARNIPFNTVFGEDLRPPSTDSLATIFRAAGVQPGDTIIAYCHIGQQATAVVFAARLLGHTVKLYDGSFDDWSARSELPVEGGAPSGGIDRD